MHRGSLTFVLCIVLVAVAALPSKQNAGPPTEFQYHRIPSPDGGAIFEKSVLLPVILAASAASSGMEWSATFPVDSDVLFAFSIFSPFESQLSLTLKNPSGEVVSLEGHDIPGHWPISSDGSHFVPGTSYRFDKPVVGLWTLDVTSSELLQPQGTNSAHAIIIAYNDDSVEISTHVNTYNLKVGGDVGLVTKVVDTTQRTTAALTEVVVKAELEVITPSGEFIDVPMHDDGLHYDGEANDGIYGGYINPTAPGIYSTQAVVTGKKADGTEFMRSTQHIVEVLDTQVSLNSVASGDIDKKAERLVIYLEVTSTNASPDTKFRPYVEVWGASTSGTETAVAWLSTITAVQTINGKQVLPLELDLNWLALAKATLPLTLKNVYVSDVASSVPVVSYDQITVQVPTAIHAKAKFLVAQRTNVTEITKEMRMGRNPLVRAAAAEDKSGIVLLHGYCSDTNQWEKQAHLFDESFFFLNPNANVNNDKFANLAASFAESNGLTSFGLIGHSQGGMASLHLHSFYWSPLEVANTDGGKRLIQTVGTPYMGNSGAGTASDLIAIFGLSCGSNTDLSVDGARLWLSGIPLEARKAVHFYTSTYELNTWFGDWCNFAVNLVLEWPNDGTCEYEYAMLDGGVFEGNKQKWCHSVDMTYPPQTNDPDRNELLNLLAAR